MPVSLSKRVQKVKPSPTLAMTARAAKLKAEGKDVIGLAAGEPDFDTPAYISDAGIEAIRKGMTRYTAVDGTAELKDAIIAKFKRDNALSYERSQILVSSGAKQTCFNACAALLLPTTVFGKFKMLTPVITIPPVTMKLWLTGVAAA